MCVLHIYRECYWWLSRCGLAALTAAAMGKSFVLPYGLANM